MNSFMNVFILIIAKLFVFSITNLTNTSPHKKEHLPDAPLLIILLKLSLAHLTDYGVFKLLTCTLDHA